MSPAPPPPGPAVRRRRALIAQRAISVGWKVLVLTLGAAIPRSLLADGIAALPSDVRQHALAARRTAAALWNGPIGRRGVVRLVRVASLERAAALPSGDAGRCDGYAARVRAYTYLGVPYSEARTACGHGRVEFPMLRRDAAVQVD